MAVLARLSRALRVRLAVAAGVLILVASFATADDDGAKAALSYLKITLPDKTTAIPNINKSLDILSREKCDHPVVNKLAQDVEIEGYPREAANALVNFADNCGNSPEELYHAGGILLKLSDYPTMIEVSNKLIKLDPQRWAGYYLRALAEDNGGSPASAAVDYKQVLVINGSMSAYNSRVYEALSRTYERLNRYCEAAEATETWVDLDPLRNRSARTDDIIATDFAKGNCTKGLAHSEPADELIPRRRGSNVATVIAIINGVPGVFIVDTGASFVAVSKSFAAKAQLVPAAKEMKLNTANGIAKGHLSLADSIRVKSLAANKIGVVVQDPESATYGSGVDGLLGMSFLSHFEISIVPNGVHLKPRN